MSFYKAYYAHFAQIYKSVIEFDHTIKPIFFLIHAEISG